MASPPPSGPNQPPYQPYPQQPYPQQYSPQYPQQPYYAPTGPPPREDRTLLYVVLAVVVVILVTGLLAVYFFFIAVNTVTNPQITVTAVSFTIDYTGTSTGYFGTGQITTCTQCPFKASIVSPFTYTLTIHNSDTADHFVTGISLSYPFTLTGTSPTLAASVPAGMSLGFTLTIQTSSFSGSYTLSGTVSTSS